jgi:hypothetical protein
MSNVVIDANDGGTPFLEARSVVARPRIFSLLAGKPDLGEVEIEDARVRAVIKGGKLTNLSYELPESSGGDGPDELPLNAVSLTNGEVDVTVDDARVHSREVDVDVTVGRMAGDEKPLLPIGLLEVSLRAGVTHVDRKHESPSAPEFDMLDEDVVCSLDLRGRVADGVLLRRLDITGAVDFDPAVGTRPSCNLPEGDWRKIALGIEGGEVRFAPDGAFDTLDGRLHVQLGHRARASPLRQHAEDPERQRLVHRR